jgi:hypothetical protein
MCSRVKKTILYLGFYLKKLLSIFHSGAIISETLRIKGILVVSYLSLEFYRRF